MKNLITITLLTVISTSVFAFEKTFKIRREESRYYYSEYIKEAAEAKVWLAAHEVCRNRNGGLPIRLKPMKTSQNAHQGIAIGDFVCLTPGEQE